MFKDFYCNIEGTMENSSIKSRNTVSRLLNVLVGNGLFSKEKDGSKMIFKNNALLESAANW